MLIHNAAITGSLTYNGVDLSDITASEASIAALNQATASLSGSIAILSSSYIATSASYVALSGSFVTTSQSMAQRVGIIEGNYVTTGSNSFSGSQVITGSLTGSSALFTGAITAQTLVVQTVTSSVVYSSGSNTFGNQTSNVQAFTGSLRVTGSGDHYILGGNVGIGTASPNLSGGSLGSSILTISATSSGRNGVLELNGTRTTSGDYVGYVRFFNNAAATPVADIQVIRGSSDTTGDLAFATGNSERMRLDSSGNLGLGVTPSAWGSGYLAFQITAQGQTLFGNKSISSVGLASNGYYNGTNWIYNNSDTAGQYQIVGNSHQWYIALSGTAGDPISFTQAMTLNASGNLGLGVIPSAWGSNYQAIELSGAVNVFGVTSDANVAGIGANLYHNNTNYLYRYSTFATMYLQDNGTHQWHIASAGIAGDPISFTQAMTLNASGNLGLGIVSPISGGSSAKWITLEGTTYSGGIVYSVNGAAKFYHYVDGDGLFTHQGQTGVGQKFITNGTERMRIFSSTGNVFIGSSPSDAGYRLDINGTGRFSGDLTGTSATFNGIFTIGSVGTATTPVSTAGWRKIGLINSRGGGRIVLSFIGGSYIPVTYVINYYKNWTNSGTLKTEKYGAASWITAVRIIQDSADSLYYIEINCISNVNGLSFQVYDQKINGYHDTATIYTGALAAGSATGTIISTAAFVTNGTTVQALEVESTTQSDIRLNSALDEDSNLRFAEAGTNKWVLYNDASADSFKIYDSTALVDRFTISGSGNVGIGVTPSAWISDVKVLDFAQAAFVGGAGIGGFIDGNSYVDSTNISRYKVNGTATRYNFQGGAHAWSIAGTGTAGNQITFTEAMKLDFNGYLGVGGGSTTITNGDLIGVLAFKSNDISTNSAGAIGSIRSYASADFNTGTVSGDLRFYTQDGGTPNGSFLSGGERMRITSPGEVWIGYTSDNGAYLLQVNSQIFATNATIATSDERLKENVQDMGSTIDLVTRMRPRTFTYKQDTKFNFNDSGVTTGFIAQELKETLADTPYSGSVVPLAGEYYGVAYEKLIPILTKAIQELKSEIDILKEQLSNK